MTENLLKERHFECQNCGICCSQKGHITPSEQNIRDLAHDLDMSEHNFILRYLQEIYDFRFDAYLLALKTPFADNKNGCIFHLNRFCAVHSLSRPDICKVFPFNHFDVEKGEWTGGILLDGKFWCEGIGRGREWSLDELKELKEKYKNLGLGFKRRMGVFQAEKEGGKSGDDLIQQSQSEEQTTENQTMANAPPLLAQVETPASIESLQDKQPECQTDPAILSKIR